ncbi:MAG: murein L,D-transpeptidase [Acidimicrobiales bacterium]|nr:murein L,D-transpeptidase [Acidimicrobiales bacterium]
MLRRLTHLALTVTLIFGLVAWAPPEADASTTVANLQTRLKAKGFYRGAIDGIAGAQTQQAIMAFRKEVGVTRSFSWSSSLDGLLRDYVRPWLPYRHDEPDRVEVNLSRQVMYLIRGNKVQQVFPISSGNGQPYTNSFGKFTNARTPTGDFKIQRHVRGERISYLGFLWNPWYFTGGYALHGSSSVPAYPASHGCVRLTMWDSDWLESQLWVGMPVHVWYEPAGVGPTFAPNADLGIGGSAGCPNGNCDRVAFQDRGGRFYLWDQLSHNPAISAFFYGNPGDTPFSGDWNGDGQKTLGLYRRSDGYVYLRNSNTQGVANITFYFGNPGDIPLAGDFDGDGYDTVSIYRPSEQRFYIINKLGADGGGLGAAEFSFQFGAPGDVPFVGDFDGNGTDTVGVYRPSTGQTFIKNTLADGPADLAFVFGNPGDKIVAGDWNGDGRDTVAVYRPTTGVFYVKNSNTTGAADAAFDVGYLQSVVTID